MGVLVLPPHDILRDGAHHQRRRLISPPRSKPRRSTSTPENIRSSRRKQWSPTGSPPPPPQSKPNRAKSPGLSGQIRILKRGEELSPKEPTKPSSAQTTPVKERKTNREASVDRSNTDLVLFKAPIRNPFINGFYAGSAFSTSPPPSSLPVPAFCAKSGGGLTLSAAEDVAVDLRRILRLEF